MQMIIISHKWIEIEIRTQFYIVLLYVHGGLACK